MRYEIKAAGSENPAYKAVLIKSTSTWRARISLAYEYSDGGGGGGGGSDKWCACLF